MKADHATRGLLYGATTGFLIAVLELKASLLMQYPPERSLIELGMRNFLIPFLLNLIFYSLAGAIVSLLIGIALNRQGYRGADKVRQVPLLVIFIPSAAYMMALVHYISVNDQLGRLSESLGNYLFSIAVLATLLFCLSRTAVGGTADRASTGWPRSRGLRAFYAGALIFFSVYMLRDLSFVPKAEGNVQTKSPAVSSSAPRSSVLLITIDTLRRDHLGCYGSGEMYTPNIDAIAHEGVKFENAFATAPLTLPSHASLFTGKYPSSHGVRANSKWRVLDPSHPTLAEILWRSGYATAAFVGAGLLGRQSGLAKGFDHYGDIFDRMWLRQFRKGNFLLPRLLILTGLMEKAVVLVRDADEISSKAIQWLKENREKEFFLWLHYYDPHGPHKPHPEFLQSYQKKSGMESVSRDAYSRSRILYKGEVSYTDFHIGRVLDTLRELGMMDTTLLIITSDHGQSLGEHEYYGHGFVIYEQTIRIPLIMRLPGIIRPHQVVGSLVSSIDIAPTVLDILAIPGDTDFQGQSLYSLMREGGGTLRDFVYFETLAAYEQRKFLFGVRGIDWKLIRQLPGGTEELFDIRSDPGELWDVAHGNEAVAESLGAVVESFIGSKEILEETGAADLREGEVEELKALGYIQ